VKIETKFDRGDKVWVPTITDSEWVVLRCEQTIEDIEIEVDSSGVHIWYHTRIFKSSLLEERCFASHGEAQEYCDSLN
jgi:hypothetical protein